MNVTLTPELERMVQGKVESGKYASESEVVREALLMMEETEEARAKYLHDLRLRMDEGIRQAECGETVDGETFMQGMLDELDALETPR